MQSNFFEDALANPKNYTLELFNRETENYDGHLAYQTIAYLCKVGVTGPHAHERIDDPGDIEDLVDTFKKHNPDGLDVK
jgi:hypothetical protein